MKPKLTIYDKIKQYVDASKGYVVLTRELLPFGSKSEVSRVLKKMNDEWYLRRISIGVYAKTVWSERYQQRFIENDLDVMAYEAFMKLGIKIRPGWAIRNIVAGRSTQVPCRIFFDTMGKNITRKFNCNGMTVNYEDEAKRSINRGY